MRTLSPLIPHKVGIKVIPSGKSNGVVNFFLCEIFRSCTPRRCDKINPNEPNFRRYRRYRVVFKRFRAFALACRARAFSLTSSGGNRWSVSGENAANSRTFSFYRWRIKHGWFDFHGSIFRDKFIVVSGYFGRDFKAASLDRGEEGRKRVKEKKRNKRKGDVRERRAEEG